MTEKSTITNEQRDQAYLTATKNQVFLYESPESGRLLWALAAKHSLTEPKKYTALSVLAGDIILNLEKQSNLPTLLAQRLEISQERAVSITGDLIDYLSTTAPAEGLTLTGEGTTNEFDSTLESEIAETEAALNAIPQMRTMVQDAKESKTHTTSQSDLLNKQNRWTPKK